WPNRSTTIGLLRWPAAVPTSHAPMRGRPPIDQRQPCRHRRCPCTLVSSSLVRLTLTRHRNAVFQPATLAICVWVAPWGVLMKTAAYGPLRGLLVEISATPCCRFFASRAEPAAPDHHHDHEFHFALVHLYHAM